MAERNELRSRLSRGQAIKYVRETLCKDDFGRRTYTQPLLYRKCTEIESSDGQTRERLSFSPVAHDDYAKSKIRSIEQSNDDDLTFYVCGVIARAFNLPPEFFNIEYQNIDQLTNAYHSLRTPTGADPRTFPSRHVGFRRIPDTERLTPSRKRLADKLSDFYNSNSAQSSLVIVDGPSSIGKTFFLGRWHRDFGQKLFPHLTLCLDCTNTTFDQLYQVILDALALDQKQQANPETLADILVKVPRYLIALDGLRYDRTASGSPILIDGAQQHRKISELIIGLQPLFAASGRTNLILCVENNRRELDLDPFVRDLPYGVADFRISIGSLEPEEGALFLIESGANRIAESQLLPIVNALHGMPIALKIAALELRHADESTQERYVDLVSASETHSSNSLGSNEFIDAFQRYLRRLISSHDQSKNSSGSRIDASQDNFVPHPLAVLRFLALMPGAVSREFITFLSEPGKIARLGRLSPAFIDRMESPYVSVVDGSYDLHAMARRLLREEIGRFLDTNSFDEHTSRKELEWVHWRASQWHWRILKDADAHDAELMSSVSAFVYHAIEQIRTIPAADQHRHTKKHVSGITDSVIERFEKEPGTCSDSQLFQIVYYRVVKKFLLDPRHIPTRIFGQFAAKARILDNLVSAVERGVQFDQLELANLYKEKAMCWMHNGYLQSSLETIRKAEVLTRNALEDGSRTANQFLDSLSESSSGREKELWRLLSDVASTECIIRLRLGRPLEDIIGVLSPYAKAAFRIAESIEVTGRRVDHERPSALHSGVVRIISRHADLLLCIGDELKATQVFEIAESVRRLARGRTLDGEPARRFALALVRTRQDRENAIGRACELIDSNIEHLVSFSKSHDRPSNDLIPFMVMRAAIHRVSGDFDSAESVLREVDCHQQMRHRACTFIAAAEYTLERSRLTTCRGGADVAKSIDRLTRLTRWARDNHHFILEHECDLIRAEFDDDAREKLIRSSLIYFRGIGYGCRLKDIELLKAGKSAIAELGL